MTDKDPYLSKTSIAQPQGDAMLGRTTTNITDSLEDATHTHNGAETLKSEYFETEHVNPGDNPARQPDFRDQPGQWFDDNINENNPEVMAVLNDRPKSDEINEQNRYASLDNAQKRALPAQDQHSS